MYYQANNLSPEVSTKCVENFHARKHIKLYIKYYVFIFCIFNFLWKYLCIITYACEKWPPPYKLLILFIQYFSLKFIPYTFYIWRITKKIFLSHVLKNGNYEYAHHTNIQHICHHLQVNIHTISGCPWPSDTVKSLGSPSMSWKSCAKKIPGPGSCEAPCVKSRSQNRDPTSWKSRPKSFQVLILETVSVKIQAPKLRSQVLKTMSWKPYPKISQAPKLKSQVLTTMSWKPYPKISQVFLGLGNPECKL